MLVSRIAEAAEIFGLGFDGLIRLGRLILPEEFAEMEPEPTAARPGTHDKICALRERFRRGELLFTDFDAPPADRTRPELLLVVQLEARDRRAAVIEAKGLLRRWDSDGPFTLPERV